MVLIAAALIVSTSCWGELAAAQLLDCKEVGVRTIPATTSILAWGSDSGGQLGSDVAVAGLEPRATLAAPLPAPTFIPSPAPPRITKIVGGLAHTVVLDTSGGAVYIAGEGKAGQLASGPSVVSSRTFASIPYFVPDRSPMTANGVRFLDIAAGFYHTCVLADRIFCSGSNIKGQSGPLGTINGNVSTVASSADVPKNSFFLQAVSSTTDLFNRARIVAIAAASYTTVAITDKGAVWAWGSNEYGLLATSTDTVKSSHIPVILTQLSALLSITEVKCGFAFCLALTRTRKLYGWGSNIRGQLGLGALVKFSTEPVLILSEVTYFAAGGDFVLAVSLDQLHCWGDLTMGACGLGPRLTASNDPWILRKPTIVPFFAKLTNLVSVAAGAKHSIVMDSCGNVYTSGSDGFGQMGSGPMETLDDSFRVMTHTPNRNIARLASARRPVLVFAGQFTSFAVVPYLDDRI